VIYVEGRSLNYDRELENSSFLLAVVEVSRPKYTHNCWRQSYSGCQHQSTVIYSRRRPRRHTCFLLVSL